MSVLYLVRHGQASFASENYDRLSENGFRQSEVTGDFFAETGIRFDAVYSGDMARQLDTARTVLGRMGDQADLEIQVLPGLNEYPSDEVVKTQIPMILEEDPDMAEQVDRMLEDRRSFQLVFEKIMMRWVSGRYDAPGCPTWADFKSRVREAAAQIMKETGRKKKVAVFSSGGPICAIAQMALDLTDEMAIRMNWQIRNASISSFFYNDNSIMVSSFNSATHLEMRNENSLITYR